MNLFNPPKFVKGVYLRSGDQAFIVLSQFVYNASRQHWSVEEINLVKKHAMNGCHQHFLQTIKDHIL